MTIPSPIWTPPPGMLERAEMTTWLRELGLADYDALWEWSPMSGASGGGSGTGTG